MCHGRRLRPGWVLLFTLRKGEVPEPQNAKTLSAAAAPGAVPAHAAADGTHGGRNESNEFNDDGADVYTLSPLTAVGNLPPSRESPDLSDSPLMR